MLTIKIDIQGHLINGQVGEIAHIGIAQNLFESYSIHRLVCKQLPQAIIASNFSGQYCWVGTEKKDTEIPMEKGLTPPSFNRTQFPLALAWLMRSVE